MSEVSETFVQIVQAFRVLAQGAGDIGYRLSYLGNGIWSQIPRRKGRYPHFTIS